MIEIYNLVKKKIKLEDLVYLSYLKKKEAKSA